MSPPRDRLPLPDWRWIKDLLANSLRLDSGSLSNKKPAAAVSAAAKPRTSWKWSLDLNRWNWPRYPVG